MIFFNNKIIKIISIIILSLFVFSIKTSAQTVNVDASKLVYKPEITFSPSAGSFVEGSTFDVPVIINTKKTNINGIKIKILFDKNKLSIIKPSNSTSIIGIWAEPPKYDNTKGAASFVGVIPNGIITDSGIITSITFKAISTGKASVSISSDSNLLLNDGLGTEINFETQKANYNIIPKAPEGLNIYSNTHPFQADWYNNNNPILSWDSEPNVDGFSYELDNKPKTIPDDTIDTKDTIKSYNKLNDGLWYFHIKAIKNGVWGSAGHFLIRIDTQPPAEFKPEINYVVASAIFVERTLISFFTTDNLSGVDHYEVGVIDKTQPTTESPVFVYSESPFQIPINSKSDLRVIVRAIDKAGNIRDVSVDAKMPLVITKFIKDYLVYILIFIIILGLIILIIHYLFGHHIIRKIKEISGIINREDDNHLQ